MTPILSPGSRGFRIIYYMYLFYRYPDVMVHRLLGVACGAYSTSSALLDLQAVKVLLAVIHFRCGW